MRTSLLRLLVPALVAALVVAACGDDDPPDTAAPTSTSSTTAVPDTAVGLAQPAVWPGSDVAPDTPEEAATAFVEDLLGVPAVLGPFQQGDARSGEIEVGLRTEDGRGSDQVRTTLLLRQLAPTEGWYVIAAVSEGMAITSPTIEDSPSGEVVVAGSGRGFEGTVVVQVVIPGVAEPVAEAIAAGGSMGELEPWEVTLDLSEVAPGTVVGIVAKGGVGLETDPGEVAALPVVVG